jgi:hypothetical protein
MCLNIQNIYTSKKMHEWIEVQYKTNWSLPAGHLSPDFMKILSFGAMTSEFG